MKYTSILIFLFSALVGIKAQDLKKGQWLKQQFQALEDGDSLVIPSGKYTIRDGFYEIEANNVHIIGQGLTEIVTLDPFEHVLIAHSQRLTLSNLHLRHEGQRLDYKCTEGVLRIENCKDCLIERCDINGCGIIGIQFGYFRKEHQRKIRVQNCHIHNNSNAAFGINYRDLEEHQIQAKELEKKYGIYLQNNTIENNGKYRWFPQRL
ncbi:MAG: hypothetical protein GY810_12925 [Aureispira sp.]|nr:hypothetical protein [Aureispira sp.]